MPSSCRRDLVGKAALKFVVRTELDHLKVAVQLDRRIGGRSPASQPNVIVFEFERPIRFEAVFDTHSCQPPRAGVGPLPGERQGESGPARRPDRAGCIVTRHEVLRASIAGRGQR